MPRYEGPRRRGRRLHRQRRRPAPPRRRPHGHRGRQSGQGPPLGGARRRRSPRRRRPGPTPDGTAIRDYIHVDDLARAHLLALEVTVDPGHHIFNLGNGTGFSVREVVDPVRLVTGCQLPAVESPRRPGDPPVLVASSERIRAELAPRDG